MSKSKAKVQAAPGPISAKLAQCRRDDFVAWLMKSEPDVFSVDDLKNKKKTAWDGVRNYQARNFMKDEMKVGDLVLFYHSNAAPSGVAGIGKVVRPAFADPSQFDPKSPYYDEKVTKDLPRWYCVEVGFVEKFSSLVSLEVLKTHAAFKDMLVVRPGQRLSIQPCTRKEFEAVCKLGRANSSA